MLSCISFSAIPGKQLFKRFPAGFILFHESTEPFKLVSHREIRHIFFVNIQIMGEKQRIACVDIPVVPRSSLSCLLCLRRQS